jgi:hypothetical protein
VIVGSAILIVSTKGKREMQKRLAWLCLLAVSAAFVVTSSEASVRSTPQEMKQAGSATQRCLRANLTLRLIDTDAAMGGVRSSGYAFKNNGASACSLVGFPKLQLLNKAGKPMGTKKIHNAEETPVAVELPAGGEAFFHVDFNEGGAGHEGPPCPASTKVKITAPGTTAPFVRKDAISLCGDVTVSALSSTAPF